MEINLVGEGLKFMVLGMTVVLFFLVILVQVMKLQATIINKYFPEKAPEASPASTDAIQDTHHVAAIMAAVAEFRKKHK
jgi:oxaloacetate decarboxylase gamma subunit